LKQLPLFIFVLPGVIAYGLQQQGIIELAKSDQALPTMIAVLLPVGVRGLVVAGLLAALMSSLSSVFNSCSTLVTFDIYKKLHPQASDRRLVWVGRISTVVLVGLGLAWIPFMEHFSEQLYVYLQRVQAYISPPITAVFLFGLLWRRTTAQGAICSLVIGFILGMGRLVAELTKDSLGDLLGGELLYYFATINFLHFAVLLFGVCVTVLVSVSLVTPPPKPEQLEGLTIRWKKGSRTAATGGVRRVNVLLSVGLVVLATVIWCYFS
jgi:SSS family solute:Na+ symporter